MKYSNSLFDISLAYTGGSGGFLALWILLLGTDYRCDFSKKHRHKDLKDIFIEHWKSTDEHGVNYMLTNTWKSTEIWPINEATEKMSGKKIFYNCNEDFYKNNSIKITVYVDSKKHWEICKLKQCWILSFLSDSSMTDELVKMYNVRKDDMWPTVNSFEDIKNLPEVIKQELEEKKFSFKIFNDIEETLYNAKIALVSARQYKDDTVFFNTNIDLLSKADIAVKWQDLVNTNGDCLLEHFGKTHTPEIADFIDYYKNKLHPKNFI